MTRKPFNSATAILPLLASAALATTLVADEPREKPSPEAEAKERREDEARRERAERDGRPEKPSPSELKQRLADLMAQARDAEADGNRERLADLKPQIAEIQQLLKRISSANPELPPELRPQAEKLEILARRIKHVFVAAENLQAADMPDLAHELRQKAAAMERELAAGKEELMARAHAHKSPKPENPNRELQALREENEKLQRRLRELSEQLERQRD